MVPVLIPESVSFPQIEKLLAEDAGKRGACGYIICLVKFLLILGVRLVIEISALVKSLLDYIVFA